MVQSIREIVEVNLTPREYLSLFLHTILVYSVVNCRPRLSTFWANVILTFSTYSLAVTF